MATKKIEQTILLSKEHINSIMNLLNDVRLLLLDVDTPTREQRSDIVHRIAQLAAAMQIATARGHVSET